MPFDFQIPRASSDPLNFALNVGESIFLLGANGTGKSTLMHRFYSAYSTTARRISAHRQTWFESNALTMTAQDRRNTEQNMRGRDTNPDSRWIDHYSGQRSNMAIYDLIDAENVRARGIATAVDADDIKLARLLSKKDAPIRIINGLLRQSNMPITIAVKAGEQVVARKDGGEEYSIAELSDGERNALLIAATVLTVDAGALMLIDEPERHLHRSIISPLLTLLFAHRDDCAFIVSTHESMLPVDNLAARTLLVRSCAYKDRTPISWEVDLVPSSNVLDEDIKQDILGARRRIIFVEGADTSLDKPLYSLIFPGISVVAKGGYKEVERAVKGVRSAEGYHWVRPFGIVDSDNRTAGDVAALAANKVFALPVCAVEAIYYGDELQGRIAKRQAALQIAKEQVDASGGSAAAIDPAKIETASGGLLYCAKKAALGAIAPHVEDLAARVVERTLRQQAMAKLPSRQQVLAGAPLNITLDAPTELAAEVAKLNALIAGDDLKQIVERYPVRETPALGLIALKLGYASRKKYEEDVRQLLSEDDAALAAVRALFGALVAELAA